MELLSFDDYFYEVWDGIDYSVVSPKIFRKNQDLIREVTYSMWNIYKNTYREVEEDYYVSDMSVERCTNVLSAIFLAFKNIGFKNN